MGPLDHQLFDHDDLRSRGRSHRGRLAHRPDYNDLLLLRCLGESRRDRLPPGQISYTYDSATGQETSVTTANTDIQYAYNLEGQLYTVTVDKLDGVNLSTPLVTTYADYDADGNLKETIMANGTVETRGYDTLNRLKSIATYDASMTDGVLVLGNVIVGYDYTLDLDGNRTSVTEHGVDAGRTVRYTYDADSRLTSEQIFSSDSATTPERSYTYSYDLAGNRLEMTDTGDGTGSSDLNSDYDEDGRLTDVSGSSDGQGYYESFTYDLAGNTKTDTVTSGADEDDSTTTVTTYGWDIEGRMISAVTTVTVGDTETENQHVSYTYDDDGNRLSATISTPSTTAQTTTYLNDPNQAYDQVLEEYQPGGVKLTYVRGLDLLFEDVSGATPTPVRSFYAVDGLGSTRALTNSTGAVTDTYTFDVFGNLIGQTINSHTTNEFLYAGYQFDVTIGQNYLRARYYNQVTGEFDSRDSFDGNTSDPITRNHYLYAGADPVNDIDPNGHYDLAISLGIGSAISQALDGLDAGAAVGVLGAATLAVAAIAASQIGLFPNLGLSQASEQLELWELFGSQDLVTARIIAQDLVEAAVKERTNNKVQILYHYSSQEATLSIFRDQEMIVTRKWGSHPRGAYATSIAPWTPGITQKSLAQIFYFNANRQKNQDLSWYVVIANDIIPTFQLVSAVTQEWVCPAPVGVPVVPVHAIIVGLNPMP